MFANKTLETITLTAIMYHHCSPTQLPQLKYIGKDKFDILAAEDGAVRHECGITRRVEDIMNYVQSL